MKIDTILPLFGGFYQSTFDSFFDDEIDNIIEHYNEENETDLNSDNFIFKYDWVGYSKKIAEHTIDYIKEELPNLINGYVYQDLYMPREYNFNSDEIQIELDFNKDVLLELFTENRIELQEKIKDNFTSCGGFVSFISNDYNAWLEALINFDENDKHLPIMVAQIIDFLLEADYHNNDIESSIAEKCEVSNLVEYELKKEE